MEPVLDNLEDNFEFLFKNIDSIDFMNNIEMKNDVTNIDELTFLNEPLTTLLMNNNDDISELNLYNFIDQTELSNTNSPTSSSSSSNIENMNLVDTNDIFNISQTESSQLNQVESIASLLSADLINSLLPAEKSGPISITLPEIENDGLKISSEIILNFDQLNNDNSNSLINDGFSLIEQINHDENLSITVDKPDTSFNIDSDQEELENEDSNVIILIEKIIVLHYYLLIH